MPPDPETRIVNKRKHHKKSRAGCKSCKTRRVKCDEVHPTCHACSKRRIECLWDDSEQDKPERILQMVLTYAASSTLSSDLSLSSGSFDLIALELLHNFVTSTVLSFIPDQGEGCNNYSILAPQMGLKHDYLMHAIFAISALHLHSTRPSAAKNYLARAKSHCQRAIVGFKNAPPNEVPLDVSFLTNCFLASYWISSPSWGEVGTPDLFDWLPTARIFMQPLAAYWSAVLKGIVKSSPFLPLCITMTPDRIALPERVCNIHRIEHCPFDPNELHDPNAIATYQLTIEKLHYALNIFISPVVSKLAIYLFPSSMSDLFYSYFLEKRPRALIIVAHYCAMLSQFEGSWWYGEHRSRHDIQKIVSLLDKKWLPWLEFPLSLLETQRTVALEAYFGPGVNDESPLPVPLDGSISFPPASLSQFAQNEDNPFPLGIGMSPVASGREPPTPNVSSPKGHDLPPMNDSTFFPSGNDLTFPAGNDLFFGL